MTGIDDRRGFALPVAIFVIAFLTISLAAVTAMISSERRVLDNSLAQVEALSLAQTGLDLFVADRAAYGLVATPPAANEFTQITLSGGYADVTLELIRPAVPGSDALYVVRSLGVLTDPALSGTPLAQRMVAQYAQWTTGTMNVGASWMSLSGLTKNGKVGTVSGIDNSCTATPACGCQGDVAGVSVPEPPGLTLSGQQGKGKPWRPDGDPPVEDLGTVSEAVANMDIDWQGIANGTALTPDVILPPNAPTTSPPWPSFSDPTYWPTIFEDGDLAIDESSPPWSGQGILIVTGDLTLNGSVTWQGVILAGGALTSNGENTVLGATLSALNVTLGDEVGAGDVGNGTKTFQYDSCAVQQALAGFAGLQTYPNAWTDNWPTY